MPRVLSAVDIGSNTIHLLAAECDGEAFRRIANETDWIGLGEVVGREGQIPTNLIDRTVQVLLSYKSICKSAGVSAMYLFATEAVRTAANQGEVVEAIQNRTGLRLEVIRGQREAELALAGVQLDSPTTSTCIVAEIGGGSAQIALCNRGKIVAESSLPLGTGKLTARFDLRYPINDVTEAQIESLVAQLLRADAPEAEAETVIASGGVARGLWRALHPDGGRRLHSRELRYIQWVCAREAIDTISRRFNVKLKRAGTLHLGSLVFRHILSHAKVDQMYISEYGVREGAIMEMNRGDLEGTKI